MSDDKTKKPIMISHSSMECMEQCLLKWYYKYIEKLKVSVPVGPEAEFGSYIHKIAETFKGNDAKELKQLAKETLKQYKVDPVMKKKIPKAIRNFWRYWEENLKDLNITDKNKEKKIITNSFDENFNIMGVFDLIFFDKNKKLTVLDWKTNSKPRDATKQLSFYFYILRLVGEIPESQPTLEAKIVYLCVDAKDDYIEVPYVIDELELETAASRLESFINRVKSKGTNKEKYRMNPGPLCPWCDYKKANICPGKCS